MVYQFVTKTKQVESILPITGQMAGESIASNQPSVFMKKLILILAVTAFAISMVSSAQAGQGKRIHAAKHAAKKHHHAKHHNHHHKAV